MGLPAEVAEQLLGTGALLLSDALEERPRTTGLVRLGEARKTCPRGTWVLSSGTRSHKSTPVAKMTSSPAFFSVSRLMRVRSRATSTRASFSIFQLFVTSTG